MWHVRNCTGEHALTSLQARGCSSTAAYKKMLNNHNTSTCVPQAVELPLTHPELYEDIGIKPPKVRVTPRTSVQLADMLFIEQV